MRRHRRDHPRSLPQTALEGEAAAAAPRGRGARATWVLAAGLLAACVSCSATSGPAAAPMSPPAAAAATTASTPTPSASPSTAGKQTLSELDPVTTPGAAQVDFTLVPAPLTLPEAVEVTPAPQPVTEQSGQVYLKVPATVRVVRDFLLREHPRSAALTDVHGVDVPSKDGFVLRVKDSAAHVQAAFTLAPDPSNPSWQSLLMLSWSPDTSVQP